MWHEARRSEKKVHDLMDIARKRSQRRAIFLAKRRGDPHQSLQIIGSRCRVHRDDGLYQAAQDQQGLIPWNGKQDVLVDRFDGRALLDFIRDPKSRPFRVQEKTEEEEELEQCVNFERYRDLIKHRRRGFTEEEALQHVCLELEAKFTVPSIPEKPSQLPNKGSYSQVGFSYNGNSNTETNLLNSDDEDDDDEDDDDDKYFSSDDSNDEGMDRIAKEFGINRYNWLVYMEKKAKEEERRQKEIIKGDPAVRKLSRKERRKFSQIEREREREVARTKGRTAHHDPYRESRRSPSYESYYRHRRSRSRSRSPSHSRRYERGDSCHRGKSKSKIEYITEFGGSNDVEDHKYHGVSPPSSPIQANILNRPSEGQILEALHVDPASSFLSIEHDKVSKSLKPPVSTGASSSAIAKLSKTGGVASSKAQEGEKKETPQERLKRIMSKQLNKQIKKDTAAEMAKKREQERQRQEKLAEARRLRRYSRSPSTSRSPPRRYRRRSRSRSRSRSKSPRRYSSHSSSRSRSPRYRSRSRR